MCAKCETECEHTEYNEDHECTVCGKIDPAVLEALQNVSTYSDGPIETQEAFVTAVNAAESGATIELGEGTFNLSAIKVQGGKSLTFVGADKTKTTLIYGSPYKYGYSDGGGVACYSFDGSGLITFKKVKLVDEYNNDGNGYDHGFVRAHGMYLEDCDITSTAGCWGDSGTTFKDCYFSGSNTSNYNVITYAGKNFIFEGCTFNAQKGGIQAYRTEDKSNTAYSIVVNNCSFQKNSNTTKTPIYFYDSVSNGGTWMIYLTGTNVNINDSFSTNSTSNDWIWGSTAGDSKNNIVYVGGTLNADGTVTGATKVWEKGAKVEAPAGPTEPDHVDVVVPENVTINGTAATTEEKTAINTVVNNTAVNNMTAEDTKIETAIPSANTTLVSGLNNVTVDGETVKLNGVEAVVAKTIKLDLKAAKTGEGIVTSMTFDVKPMITVTNGTDTVSGVINNDKITTPITFRLPVDNSITSKLAEVKHEDELLGYYEIKGTDEKYIEISSSTFSKYSYEILKGETVNPIAAIGVTGYATIQAAIDAVISGQTITLLADLQNTGSVSLPAGVTLDGDGHKISGNSSIHINAAGGTVKNINFENIHNNTPASDEDCKHYGWIDGKTGTLSAIYANDLTGTLNINNCSFDSIDWDAIQVTPLDGATINIQNNIFKHTGTENCTQLRYIHIQRTGSAIPANVAMAINGNKFYKTKDTSAKAITTLGVWNVEVLSDTVNLTDNYFEYEDDILYTNAEVKRDASLNYYCETLFPAIGNDGNALNPVQVVGNVAYLTDEVAYGVKVNDTYKYFTLEELIKAGKTSAILLRDVHEDVTVPEGQSLNIQHGTYKLEGTIVNNGKLNLYLSTAGSPVSTATITNNGTVFMNCNAATGYTVNGGRVEITNGGTYDLSKINADTIVITGGTFTTKPDDSMLKDCYIAEENSNGTYTVRKMTEAEAINAGAIAYGTTISYGSATNYYKTLENIAEKAVVLMKDVEDLELSSVDYIYLNTNGHKFHGSINTPGHYTRIDKSFGVEVTDVTGKELDIGAWNESASASILNAHDLNTLQVNAKGDCKIEGGRYNTIKVQWRYLTTGEVDYSGTLNITGGLFKSDTVNIATSGKPRDLANPDPQPLANYVADGYEVVANTDPATKEAYPWMVVEAKTYVAQIGETKYESLQAALSASNNGDTIKLLADFVDTDSITLKANVTLDGDGHKISGDSSLYVQNGGITIKNVKFIGIHSTKENGADPGYGWSSKTGSRSAIYAEGLSGSKTITIENCYFDQIDWDGLQFTKIPDGSVINVNGNEFHNSKFNNFNGENATGIALRYIHVQVNIGNINLDISNNNFYDECIDNAIGIYNLGNDSLLKADNCYIGSKVDIAAGYRSGLPIDLAETFLPLKATADATTADYHPEAIYKDKNDAYGHGYRFATTAQELISKQNGNYSVYLNKDINLDISQFNSTHVDVNLNGFTINADLSKNLNSEDNEFIIYGNGFASSDPTKYLGEGEITKKEGNVWRVTQLKFIRNVSTGEEYDSLADAIVKAKDGESLIILRNIFLGEDSVEIPSGKTISLDLNGKEIQGTDQYVIENYGNLTIDDNSIEKTGRIYSTLDYATTKSQSFVVYNYSGTLTINSGKIEGFIALRNKGTAIVNGSNLFGQYAGVYAQTGTVTINGGTIAAGTLGSAVQTVAGTVLVKGGYYSVANPSQKYIISTFNGANTIISGGYYNDNDFYNRYSTKADGYELVANTDEATKVAYPWMVVEASKAPVTPVVDESNVQVTENTNEVTTADNASTEAQAVVEEIKNNKTVSADGASNIQAVANNNKTQIKIDLKAVAITTTTDQTTSTTTNKATYDVKPVDENGEVINNETIASMLATSGESAITFRLAVPSTMTGNTVKVTHIEDGVVKGEWTTEVQGTGTGRYVELSATSFSTYELSQLTEENAVAQIGVTYYATLQEAVEAATTNDTIKLLANVNTTSQIEVVSKDITLDLNGKTISYTGTTTLASGTILVHNGAGLTITGNGTVSSGEKAYAAIALTKKGDDPTNAAKLTIENGTIEGQYYAIVGNGTRHNTEITINGGTIKGLAENDNTAIYHPQDGTLTINGGTITGYSAAVEMRSGTLNVTGGTLTATGHPASVSANGNGTTTVGAAISVAQHTTNKNINVTISGGTISGYNGVLVANPQGNTTNVENVKVTISGGDISATNGGTEAIKKADNASAMTLTVPGTSTATFSSDVTEYAAEGYKTERNEETGRYGITVATYTVAVTSAIQGTTTTIAAVSGGGENISATEGTVLTTQPVEGYDFKGWYVGETQASDKLSFTYKPTADVTVVAVYKAKSGQRFSLTVDASIFEITDYDVEQEGYQTYKFAASESITVSFCDDSKTFLYWANENDKVVSTNREYTFTLGSNRSLHAVYTSRTNKVNSALVVFKSASDQIISARTYSTTMNIVFPAGPSKMGYKFTGWSMTETEIKAAMAESNKVVVTPYYEATGETYTITVKYAGIDKADDTYILDAGDAKTLTAEAKVGDSDFSCWKDADGNVLAYTNLFGVRSTTNVTLTAVYGETSTKVATINITSVKADMNGAKYRMTFSQDWALLDTDTLVKAGFVMTTNASTATKSALVLDGPNTKTYTSSLDTKIGHYDQYLNTSNPDLTVYMRAYVQYLDSSAHLQTIYSDIVSGSYNTIHGGQ